MVTKAKPTKKATKKPAAKKVTTAEPEKVNRRGNKRGTNPKSQANLQRFPPGVSGNPAGQPKGARQRSSLIADWLDAKITVFDPTTKKKRRMTVEDAMVLSMIQQVLVKGNVKAYGILKDELYGKIAQPITGGDGQPLMQPISDALLKVYGHDAPDADPEQ